MVKLNWDGNDFRNSQDSSGAVADNISRNGNLQQGYSHGSLTRGLVAYYPMEKGEGEVLHDGAMDNLGQINGADWASGKIRLNSLSFNGSDNYVQTSTKGPYDQEAWTIFIWLKTSATGNNAAIGNYDGSFPQVKIVVDEDGNGKAKLRVRDSGGSDVQPSSNTTVNDGQWHHILGQRRNGKINLFVDGVKENSVDDGTSELDLTSADVRIGSRSDDMEFFNGKLEEARFYNRALSKPEINALYNGGNGVQSGVRETEKKTPGLNEGGISRYKFDGNVEDAWGENDGTNNGAVYTSERVYGDEAVIFSDNEEYIEVSDSSSLDLNSFTLSIWAKPSGSTGGDITYTFGNLFNRYGSYSWADKQHGFALRYSDDFDYWQGGAVIGGNNTVLQGSQVEKEKWTHLVLIFDTTKLLLYEEGKLKDSKSVSGDLQTRVSNALIGTGTSGRDHYLGAIDDVRIYSEALDPDQVEQLYHKGAYRIPRKSTLQ